MKVGRFSLWILVGAAAILCGCARAVTPVVALERPAPAPAQASAPADALEPQAGQLGQDGLLTQTAFALELGRVMESLRPGWEATVLRDVMLVLVRDGDPGPTLPIGPVYSEYRNQAENKAEVMHRAASDAIYLYEALADWEQAQRWLQPMLVSTHRVSQLIDQGAMPVVIPQSEEINLLFEVRIYGKSHLVHLGLQAQWSQQDEALYAAALANLEAVDTSPVLEADGVWRFYGTRGQTAARVLLVDRLTELAELNPGGLILALPSEESLYAFPANDPALLEQMRARTEREFRTAERPLTRTWLIFEGGQLRPYQL